MTRPCVFFDRDDTLIVNRDVTRDTPHPGDLYDPALVRLIDGAGQALRDLAESGFALVVVSNQGAVARGHCTLDDVAATNGRMRELLRDGFGVELDGVYVCPYHPKGTTTPYNTEHPTRKPAPGMLLQAAEELDLDLSRSWMIGDMPRDIQAALAAGLNSDRTLLLDDDLTITRAAARVLESRA